MNNKTLIVVSAENNPYMAWQCKLFHFSCITRLNCTPIIVAHETGSELHADFTEIMKAGGEVHTAPSYKQTAHGDLYPPRNTPGTLLRAADLCAEEDVSIVLCDPDMIFLRLPKFPSSLSGDYCSYMNYDLECVEVARVQLGISREAVEEEKPALRCGVPYSIPAGTARQLARAWIKAIDAFPPRKWEDVMYAFGLAATEIGLKVTLTQFAQSNYWPDETATAEVIHYCYGDERWSKRHYFREEHARRVWESDSDAPTGSVLGQILAQIREAKEFYSSF